MADASSPRKKSPRAPSIALDEAIERVMRVYENERLHPAPTEVVAQNLGYKGAASGSALSAMASLRYYGLLERPSDGFLAVTKEVETFKFAPDERLRRSLLIGFLRRPALFAELLEKYSTGLPSDANLKFDLIQRSFLPGTAADVVAVFRRSVEFTGYFESSAPDVLPAAVAEFEVGEEEVGVVPSPPESTARAQRSLPALPPDIPDAEQHDRIPIRLPGSRRAWLVIPSPFYAADKLRLKAQIDLLLTEDEE